LNVAGERAKWEVVLADCVEHLKTLPENSVDSVVCDPPYGLEFMGKEWDRLGNMGQGGSVAPVKGYGDFSERMGSNPRFNSDRNARCGTCGHWRFSGTPCVCPEPVFPNLKLADAEAMGAWHLRWAIEVFRVLKPGGHLLAFGGTRTYHRLACAVEDAGFEIRDTINWVYASGFPKSHDVSKAIDRKAGAEREIIGTGVTGAAYTAHGPDGFNPGQKEYDITEPATEEAELWDGWGTALKPAHEPILVARKPLIGTVAENVLRFGTGALNVDACRVGTIASIPGSVHPNRSRLHGIDNRWVELVSPPDPSPLGRWPPNLVLTHAPECRANGIKTVTGSGHWSEYDYETSPPGEPAPTRICGGGKGLRPNATYTGGKSPATEQCESWSCAPGCPVAEMDRQSGESNQYARILHARYERREEGDFGLRSGDTIIPHTDTGGASRFFPTFSWHTEEVSFIYSPKAARSEREAGLEGSAPVAVARSNRAQADLERWVDDFNPQGGNGMNDIVKVKNHHPTVKPIALLRWLTRLVTPTGGTVLDPFAGSGSEGCAAVIEGFNYIGIEKEPEYAEIAKKRIAYWKTVPKSQAPTNTLASAKKPTVTLASFDGPISRPIPAIPPSESP
jgi:DNA modification methylase